MNMGEIKRVFSLSKTVRKEAKELDRLSGGALAAFLGGSLVIGVLGGGIWWVLTGMAGTLSLYRFSKAYINYLPFFKRANIANFNDIFEDLEKLERSALPNNIKDNLSANLLSQLPSATLSNTKQLEHVKSDKSHNK